jgi:hypothetical protein
MTEPSEDKRGARRAEKASGCTAWGRGSNQACGTAFAQLTRLMRFASR